LECYVQTIGHLAAGNQAALKKLAIADGEATVPPALAEISRHLRDLLDGYRQRTKLLGHSGLLAATDALGNALGNHEFAEAWLSA